MERRNFFFKTLVTNFLRLLQERTKKKTKKSLYLSIDGPVLSKKGVTLVGGCPYSSVCWNDSGRRKKKSRRSRSHTSGRAAKMFFKEEEEEEIV